MNMIPIFIQHPHVKTHFQMETPSDYQSVQKREEEGSRATWRLLE